MNISDFKTVLEDLVHTKLYTSSKISNEQNKKYRRRLVLQLVLVLAIIPYGIISIPILTQLHSTNPDFVGIATGIVVAGFVAWFVGLIVVTNKIRCPHCNKWLGNSNPWNIPNCPYCKTSLKT